MLFDIQNFRRSSVTTTVPVSMLVNSHIAAAGFSLPVFLPSLFTLILSFASSVECDVFAFEFEDFVYAFACEPVDCEYAG